MKEVISDLKTEDKSEGEQNETQKPKDGSDQLQVKQKEEESDEETEDETGDEMDDETEEEEMDEKMQSKIEEALDGTPQQSASVVKYNVKTTPYLQR